MSIRYEYEIMVYPFKPFYRVFRCYTRFKSQYCSPYPKLVPCVARGQILETDISGVHSVIITTVMIFKSVYNDLATGKFADTGWHNIDRIWIFAWDKKKYFEDVILSPNVYSFIEDCNDEDLLIILGIFDDEFYS